MRRVGYGVNDKANLNEKKFEGVNEIFNIICGVFFLYLSLLLKVNN